MDSFEEYTDTMQKIYFNFLDGKQYDVLLANQLCLFPQILSNYMQSSRAEELSKQIVRSSILYYRIIIVNCYAEGEVFSVPVVRVQKEIRNENDEDIYDIDRRRYESWEDFLLNNRLPECLMKFPENGKYEMVNGNLKFGRRNSPASRKTRKVHEVIRKCSIIGSLVALIATDIPQLKPYNNAIAIFSGICNGYEVCHNAYQVYDIVKHGHGLKSDESVSRFIDIGIGVLLFSVTVGKIKLGINQSDRIAYKNLFMMAKELMGSGDDVSSLKKIEVVFLCQHLTHFSNEAIGYFQNNVLCSRIDVNELIFNIRRYVLKDNKLSSKFRQFVSVKYATISTVAQDITLAKNIPKLIQMHFYDAICSLNEEVDSIMKEIKHWASENASNMQTMFRVTGMCKDLKTYETVEEMCKHFNVSNPKEILVNERYIFEGPGEAFLELQKTYDVEKFPQFLMWAVRYLGEGHDNLEEFIKCLNDRLVKEMGMTRLVSQREIEWINALTLENLNYAHSVPEEGIIGGQIEGINLVKPKFRNEENVTYVDLFKLAKRLLGRVGELDFQLVRSDVKFVVAASKRSRYAVIVAPKMDLKGSGSMAECYPVFKRLI